MYRACEACKEARANNQWDEIVSCRDCNGKGFVRVRESWICNQCGGCLCPAKETMNGESPHGLVDAKVAGGYDSTHLSDCTTYKFSICEGCLRTLFNGFKIPPQVGEYLLSRGDEIDDTESYKKEAEDRLKQDESNRINRETQIKLIESNLCSHTIANGQKYCGDAGVVFTDYGFGKQPACVKHGRDAYALDHHVIYASDRVVTFENRCAIGKRYLQAFKESATLEPLDEHERTIFITTLFSLVIRPATHERAVRELVRVSCAQPAQCDTWQNGRVPAYFGPNRGREAAVANAWLAWGREQGYANGVAHACLGYTAESLWDKDAERQHNDEACS